MYKITSSLYAIFALIALAVFTGCDGRQSSYQALKQDITDFKKEIKFEVTEYIPSAYFESRVDTILDSGYRLSIKTTADPSDEIVVTTIRDTINYQSHYKHFIFNVELYDSDKLLVSEKFTKQRINALLKHSKLDLIKFQNQILNAINIDFEHSNEDVIILELLYELPNGADETLLNLKLNASGELILRPTKL